MGIDWIWSNGKIVKKKWVRIRTHTSKAGKTKIVIYLLSLNVINDHYWPLDSPIWRGKIHVNFGHFLCSKTTQKMDTVSCSILGKFLQELSHTKIKWFNTVYKLKHIQIWSNNIGNWLRYSNLTNRLHFFVHFVHRFC